MSIQSLYGFKFELNGEVHPLLTRAARAAAYLTVVLPGDPASTVAALERLNMFGWNWVYGLSLLDYSLRYVRGEVCIDRLHGAPAACGTRVVLPGLICLNHCAASSLPQPG
ncbi:MAG: hypothetical protein ACRERV_03520 [Methylococcales bacterium]